MHEDPLIGRVISNNYRVEKKIGEGGPATVYLGKDVLLDLPIAIKYLKPQTKEDPSHVERFLREARTQARLNHQNIISIRSVLEEEGDYFIVMEFVDGTDLEQCYRNSQSEPKFSLELFQIIFSQVLKALSYAHQHGVFHRDLKPSNIMLTSNNIVKIADFGIARSTREPKLTKTGTIVGTPFYMAPEHIKEAKMDQRGDIYSIGVTMFEVLSGQTPFEDLNQELPIHEILRRQFFEIPPAFKELGVTLPEQLEAVIRKCLEKEPGDRFQSCKELLVALEQALIAALHKTSSESGLNNAPPSLLDLIIPTKEEPDVSQSVDASDQVPEDLSMPIDRTPQGLSGKKNQNPLQTLNHGKQKKSKSFLPISGAIHFWKKKIVSSFDASILEDKNVQIALIVFGCACLLFLTGLFIWATSRSRQAQSLSPEVHHQRLSQTDLSQSLVSRKISKKKEVRHKIKKKNKRKQEDDLIILHNAIPVKSFQDNAETSEARRLK